MHPALVAGIWAGALLLSSVGGWLVTRLVLQLASRSRDAGRRPPRLHGPVLLEPLRVSDGPVGEGAQIVLRGGTWIGVLERLAVTGSLLAGVPEGAALVVAVKGLGRYPELRENPGASERFVIGTLASLVWSAAVGLVAVRLVAG
ncbi:conserved hypothetical protein [Cellulomonas flavigena DSM 20109]|uniref:Uncharacterized protein n=1 Tax=Cellulomonas flavigena (strain ATCC 482 / DSM 20109 / BCRC 11376 / JCM 18109 / NBRC 3775 / NCIMB 8073 / NRS 134) TaxID=446466 RepID=D5UES4_CELFN|nr:hypothetical protein [Cellulomonas flavigena]ADG74734.1 conserved hypothetical protein [Cellulomonas flavigena DSM 20109]